MARWTLPGCIQVTATAFVLYQRGCAPARSPAPDHRTLRVRSDRAGSAVGGANEKEDEMELRCPDCCRPVVDASPQNSGPELRCGNCGVQFPRDSALVALADIAPERPPTPAGDAFTLDAQRARSELANAGGAISPVTPYTDADELNGLLDNAQTIGILSSDSPATRMYVYPLSLGEAEPLLAVDSGRGPTLLGSSTGLGQGEGEDPISYTIRVLEEAVEEGNGLLADATADGARLDRIAAYLNEHRPWSGGEVCKVLDRELRASGRVLLDAEV
jgi:hypothetical protein